ncbi:UbiA family prenyltransferase [Maricaulis sp.]|uniref:UbiA family prenyltransferase n=1 Tax=Maricaulis sp. TaxID=1486257 RepID=UPI003A93D756
MDLKSIPLAVDLDETLLLVDTSVEAIVDAALHRPLDFLLALPTLAKGRPAFKQAMFDIAELDVEALPERADLVEYLWQQHSAGRVIILVTATTQPVAEAVAARFGNLFSAVYGTRDGVNLKGENKAAFLTRTCPGGFVYVGDSRADLKVWARASGMAFAGASNDVVRAAQRNGQPVEAVFANKPRGIGAWIEALRIGQWVKNVLIFVPVLLSGLYLVPEAWVQSVLGFLLLGIAASGTYLINDLVDLPADRRHRTKRARPFAAGRLNPALGLVVAPALILTALLCSFLLAPLFSIALLVYLTGSLVYSFGLKRVVMLDTVTIASLFTLRIALGAFAVGAALSEWLMVFSVFFFLSLALAKRHAEILHARPGERVRGRGYRAEDAPLTLAFGVASGTAAIVILFLYLIEDAFPSGFYSQPGLLWLAPVLMALWIMRIWTLAHRAELEDDPVSFSVRDRTSLLLAGALAASFALAVLG